MLEKYMCWAEKILHDQDSRNNVTQVIAKFSCVHARSCKILIKSCHMSFMNASIYLHD
jgi:hypothetical protein